MLPGIAYGMTNNLLVPQMHAVKEADSRADILASALQLIGGVNNSHYGAASFKYGMTRVSISRGDIRKIVSSGVASETSNFPEVTRRKAARCPPHPSFWP